MRYTNRRTLLYFTTLKPKHQGRNVLGLSAKGRGELTKGQNVHKSCSDTEHIMNKIHPK